MIKTMISTKVKMWSTITRYFNKIPKQDQDILDFENFHNVGRTFSLIRYGIYRNTFYINKIYMMYFGKPVACYKIQPILTIADAKKANKFYYMDPETIFKKYGPFDIITFIPICSAIVFKHDDKQNIIESGIVNLDTLYIYNSFYDRFQLNLEKTEDYFNSDNFSFIPVLVNSNYLNMAFQASLTNVQFILASTGVIKLSYLPDTTRIDPKYVRYTDIDSLNKVRAFFEHSKHHAYELTSIIDD